MKKFTLVMAGMLAATATSFAGFKVPRHVLLSSSLDEAKAQAAEEQKPIAFVQSDPGTT
jgi:hypothetical protein